MHVLRAVGRPVTKWSPADCVNSLNDPHVVSGLEARRRSIAGAKVKHTPRRPQTRARVTPPCALQLLQNDAVAVPINYYRVLRARKVNSTEVLRRNFESQVQSPPRVGYSEEALNARGRILGRVADCVLDYESRVQYDQKLRNGVPAVSIQSSDFAGALCLLQECGDVETVVKLGAGWLRRKPRARASRDVALAMSLAYCDLASETLSRASEVAQCYSELEAALNLLIEYNVAVGLQREVAGALKVGAWRGTAVWSSVFVPQNTPPI